MSREFTERLLEMVESGVIEADSVVMMCVKYMSEDEVKDMMEINGLLEEEEEEE